MSSGASRRSNSGISGNVPVAGIPRILELAVVERGDQLLDSLGHGHQRLEPEALAHLVERPLVVGRFLAAVDEVHLAPVYLSLDDLHQVRLAEFLPERPTLN